MRLARSINVKRELNSTSIRKRRKYHRILRLSVPKRTGIDIASVELIVVLMMRDMILIATETETGTVIGDAIPMNDPTALKARGATANGIDALNLLALRQILPSSFLHALTIKAAKCLMIQQRIGWRRFCSLCFGSTHFFARQCVLYSFSSSS